MRESRAFVAAVIAVGAAAFFLQLQPKPSGAAGLRTTLVPTAVPTRQPTPEPTLDPIEVRIIGYVKQYGGDSATYRQILASDCDVLAEQLKVENAQMEILDSTNASWRAAFGYSRAILWRRLKLRC